MTADELIAAIRSLDPGELDYYGRQDESLFPTLEALLGVTFPSSYRKFLANFGGGDGISGMYGNDPHRLNDGTVVGDTIRARRRYSLPAHYIHIESGPFGDMYCIDTSHVDSHGENPIVKLVITPSGVSGSPIQIASSFEDYFIRNLQSRLEVIQEEA